jgi:intracellular septation protein
MKFLFDFFPILLFFIAYKFGGIYVATGVAIAASFVQIGWVMARGKKVEPMMWISLAIIVVFGGATLLLHDENFIKWKPTVLYWLFAAILLGSSWLFNKNLMRLMMSKQVSLPESVWNKLNLSWAVFFIVMGITNLYVFKHFSTDIWVDFKLFGSTAMMLVFVIAQSLILAKHMNHEE